MLQNRRGEVKETSPIMNNRNRQAKRIFTHKKTQSNSLLQKKPQILLMKWNDFLQKYHLFKQLNNINNSLNSVGLHLRKKKQQLTICDVPYIQSQQISVNEKFQGDESIVQNQEQIQQVQNSNVKGSILTKSSSETNNIDQSRQTIKINNNKDNKIVISLQLSQKDQINSSNKQQDQNFTDEEQQSCKNNSKIKQTIPNESMNKDSQLNFTEQESIIQVADSLRRTACFSFDNYHDKQKNLSKNWHKQKDNQQNESLLNNQLKSKKVQVLLKLQTQQQLRRQKAQKIIKEDRQYLSKLINRK